MDTNRIISSFLKICNLADRKDVMNHLNIQWKSLKLKMIAVKHIRIPNHL